MVDDKQERREPPAPITEEEKARRRKVIDGTNQNFRLEGMTRGPVSARAAELWVNGEITAEEKMAMVDERLREIAKKNGVDYKG